MKKIFPLILLLGLGNAAHAGLQDYLPEAKLKETDAATFNVGAGLTQKIAHFNGEWVNPYGIAYAKVGAFVSGDHEFAGQVGFRYPAFLNGTDKNGFYVGVYGGSLKSKKVDNKDEIQYGAGVDLAYVLLNKERISTLSVGVGAGSEIHDSRGKMIEETKPQLQFAYTLSFGL